MENLLRNFYMHYYSVSLFCISMIALFNTGQIIFILWNNMVIENSKFTIYKYPV